MTRQLRTARQRSQELEAALLQADATLAGARAQIRAMYATFLVTSAVAFFVASPQWLQKSTPTYDMGTTYDYIYNSYSNSNSNVDVVSVHGSWSTTIPAYKPAD